MSRETNNAAAALSMDSLISACEYAMAIDDLAMRGRLVSSGVLMLNSIDGAADYAEALDTLTKDFETLLQSSQGGGHE